MYSASLPELRNHVCYAICQINIALISHVFLAVAIVLCASLLISAKYNDMKIREIFVILSIYVALPVVSGIAVVTHKRTVGAKMNATP